MCALFQNRSSPFDLQAIKFFCEEHMGATYSPSKFVEFLLYWSSRKAHIEKLSGREVLQQPTKGLEGQLKQTEDYVPRQIQSPLPSP